ncbi:MAG: EAL domain-containing protein [Rhodobacteraceae bacterium]|nr:EAL domain-containing protein [Paracoccaceae bacterium]
MGDPTLSDPAAALSSPLSMAVSAQDSDTLDLVREALNEKRVLLAYQPVVQTVLPEKVVFYEGLIRVMDRNGRIIPAKDFIDVVENTELGRMIDALALEKGLDALEMEPGLRLAINMSARSIGYPRWNRVLQAGLEKDPTIGERLILEITERTAIAIPEIVQVFMNDLQMKGISFTLDDFGSGFTSFKYLKEFYFDILKIDREYIRAIDNNTDNQAITRAIMSMARDMEMFTIAANVETAAEAEVLTKLGVDCMQGYFFGMPTITPHWQKTDPRRRVG